MDWSVRGRRPPGALAVAVVVAALVLAVAPGRAIWEADRYRRKISRATLAPSVKGTAMRAGGTRAGWGCTSDASCADSWYDYRPGLLQAYAPDGVPVHIGR